MMPLKKKKIIFFLIAPFFYFIFLSIIPAQDNLITIISPSDKSYIFRDTIYIIGKASDNVKKVRFWVNDEEGPAASPREGNFHFKVDLKLGLNKVEISDINIKTKIKLEIFSLRNYKFFVLKTYDSTGPDGFKRYIFHTGEKDKLCLDCHEMDPMKADRTMCYVYCHKNDIMKWGYMHGPAGEGACLACHNPEGKNSGYNVIVDGWWQLCMTCHEGVGTKAKYVHTAVKRQICMGCHSPHGTKRDFVLWEDGESKMCYLCHREKNIKWNVTKDENGKEIWTDAGLIPFPHKAISDGDCLGCHHPHESDDIYALRQSPGKLCTETQCHIHIKESITKHEHPYDLKPDKGSPVGIAKDIFMDEKEQIVCYSCHNPHGSDNQFCFWVPKKDLCPKCHPNTGETGIVEK